MRHVNIRSTITVLGLTAVYPATASAAGACCFIGGTCTYGNAAPGTACGSDLDDDCSDPDTCDGAGTCLPNHVADGTPLSSGSCTAVGSAGTGVNRLPAYWVRAGNPAA